MILARHAPVITGTVRRVSRLFTKNNENNDKTVNLKVKKLLCQQSTYNIQYLRNISMKMYASQNKERAQKDRMLEPVRES